MGFFFQNYAPFSIKLFILYQAPHSRELAPECGAFVVIIIIIIIIECYVQEKQGFISFTNTFSYQSEYLWSPNSGHLERCLVTKYK